MFAASEAEWKAYETLSCREIIGMIITHWVHDQHVIRALTFETVVWSSQEYALGRQSMCSHPANMQGPAGVGQSFLRAGRLTAHTC